MMVAFRGHERAPAHDGNVEHIDPAALISSSADANTWTPISAFRARPGRPSFTNSPRSVRIGSIAVACSAGISAKNPVADTAPTTRNTATRQSAAGTLKGAEQRRQRVPK